MKTINAFCIAFLRGYQWILSPLFMSLGVGCRFEPSCSHYMIQAIDKHGAVKGIFLGIRRLSKCHPLCEGGHDPVPSEKKAS